jgi:hypothetical protein
MISGDVICIVYFLFYSEKRSANAMNYPQDLDSGVVIEGGYCRALDMPVVGKPPTEVARGYCQEWTGNW